MASVQPNALLNAALAYAMRGWPVFPCNPKDKRPLTPHGVKDASTDPDVIRAWWRRWPKAMIGLALGGLPGLFVVDFDPDDTRDAPALIVELEGIIGIGLPGTWFTVTPRGGRHAFFRQPPGALLGNARGALPSKKELPVDIRGEGGYVILPPSARDDGVAYVWGAAPAGKDDLPAQPPAELIDCLLGRGKWEGQAHSSSKLSNGSIDLARASPAPIASTGDADLDAAGQAAVEKYGRAAFDADLSKLKGSLKGQRNDDLFHTAIRFAQLVAAGALDAGQAQAALVEVAKGWPNFNKSRGTIKSGWEKGLSEPRDLREVRDKGIARARRRSTYAAPPPDDAPPFAIMSAGEAGGPSDPFLASASLGRPPDPPPPSDSDFFDRILPPRGQSSRSGAKSHDRVRGKGGAKKPPGGDDKARAGQLNGELAFFPQTDLGNAERFALRWKGKLLWCPSIGWLWWDGKRWASDGAEGRVKIAEHETVRSIQDEADWLRASDLDVQVATRFKGKPDEEAVMMSDALAAWGRSSEENRRLTPIAKRAAPYLEVKAGELDANPFKINVENGTLTIEREGKSARIEFFEHNPDDLITKKAPVVYDPDAQCPKFLEFLEMVQAASGMRRFICQWLGYSFTGDASEQMLTFNHGKGKNGKSTLFEVCGMIMGDYGRSIRIETFIDQGQGRSRAGGAPTPDLAALTGIRYLRTSEPERGAKLAEALIKLATGGEPMSVRFLNREFFDMVPVFKLTMSGNYKPTIVGTDEGIWRRVRLVPWVVEIPKEQRIKDFHKVVLWPEASGILNWLLAGVVDWIEHGLIEPVEVIEATRVYREDSDPLGRFLVACTKYEDGARIQSTELHRVFIAWAKANGEREWSAKGLGGAMRERGYVNLHSDVNWWLKLRLLKAVNDFVDHQGNPLGAVVEAEGKPDDQVPF